MVKEKARVFRAFIEQMAKNATDEEALDNTEAFPKWKVGVEYKEEDVQKARVRYNDKLYKVMQPHITQADWTPDIAVSLYVEVSIEEWAEWKQPTGAHDAYSFGDKVSHLGKHWISVYQGANVWEPSESVPTLWKEVTE